MLHTQPPKLNEAGAAHPLSQARRTFKRLDSLNLPKGGQPVRTMNVCIVTSEVTGPTSASGIGTASAALARQLVAEGHQVTILDTQVLDGRPFAGDAPWDDWVQRYLKLGIALRYIDHRGGYADWRAKSWLVMQFLKENSFHLVYFNEHHGSGYYAISAKRAQIAPFTDQTYVVIAQGGLEWVQEHNNQYMRRPSDLLLMGMERRSLEWADAVLSPSEYLLQEYASYGWSIPEQAYVHPYPLLRRTQPAAGQPLPVDELVFLGRLEARKGLWLFCDAIEAMPESLRGKTVTFMGRMAETAGVSVAALLTARAAQWPFAVRFITWFSTQEAMEYLGRPGKVAVIPSLADNSPCVVYECLEHGIPFISTLNSGAQELVHPADQAEILVSPTVPALKAKLEDVLASGARSARASFKPEENLRTWKAWHSALSAAEAQGGTAKTSRRDSLSDEPVLLNVLIDNGSCDLQTLLGNLELHVYRLGGTAAHLILTSRGPAFREHIAALLQEQLPATASVVLLGVEDRQEAHDLILDADVAFFSGADCQVDLSFYLRSTALLTSGAAAAVSCVTAKAGDSGAELELHPNDLPCGDLPGAAAVQAPLASAVWSVSVPALRQELRLLPICDEVLGQWFSSATLGQRLLQRCQVSRQPYLLMPLVAARSAETQQQDSAHWYRDLTAIAQDLGVRTLVHPDAAPWFVMSSLGEPGTLDGRKALHPRTDRNGGAKQEPQPLPKRLRTLAQEFGRPLLAAQLAFANGEQSGLLDELLHGSAEVERRPVLDLLRVLADASTTTPAGFMRGEPNLCISSRLLLRVSAGRLLCGTAGPAGGRLTFYDVALKRHEAIALTATALDGKTSEGQITVIDQEVGEVMAQRRFKLSGSKPVEIGLRLPRIIGTAIVVLELKTSAPEAIALHALAIA